MPNDAYTPCPPKEYLRVVSTNTERGISPATDDMQSLTQGGFSVETPYSAKAFL